MISKLAFVLFLALSAASAYSPAPGCLPCGNIR